MQGIAPTKPWRRATDGGSGRSAGELHTPGLFRALFTQPSCTGMDAEITLQKLSLCLSTNAGEERGILVPERDHHHEKTTLAVKMQTGKKKKEQKIQISFSLKRSLKNQREIVVSAASRDY